jgi:hypothetical protein
MNETQNCSIFNFEFSEKETSWCQIRRRFNINHKYKFTHYAIRKNAHQSFRKFFSYIDGADGEDFKANYHLYKHYYHMTTIRDPIDRYISGYLEMLRRTQSRKVKRSDHYVINKFNSYLKKLNEEYRNNIFFNLHVRPQYEKLLTPDPERKLIPISFFFTMETLKDDIEIFKKKFGISISEEFPLIRKCLFESERQVIIDYIKKYNKIKLFLEKVYRIDVEIYKQVMKDKGVCYG